MTTTKIKPVGKLILVEDVDQDESTTASGIVLPDTVNHRKVKFNMVLAVGDEIFHISPGDLVLVPFDSSGIPVESGDGKEYFLISATNVLAKVT